MMSTSALPTTLTGLLARHADAGRVALFDRDQAVSFAQLADESARIATALRGLGVEPGDRVGLWLPNATAWLSAFFALDDGHEVQMLGEASDTDSDSDEEDF